MIEVGWVAAGETLELLVVAFLGFASPFTGAQIDDNRTQRTSSATMDCSHRARAR